MAKHGGKEQFRKRQIRVDDIKNDRPVDMLFVEAIAAYYANPVGYEVREVVARKIRIPENFGPTPEGLAIMRSDFSQRRKDHESGVPIAVIERSDGSLWTYDDVHLIAVYHELAPIAMVRVVIVGQDLTPVSVA